MKLPLLLCLLLPTAWLRAASPPEPARNTYNFNSAWLLHVGDQLGAESPTFADDATWQHVALPHAWNENSAFRVRINDLPTGIAWYRKHFQLPTNAVSKKIFLEFEGIRQAGEFYLNGEPIERSENGVMAFGFDVTDKLKPAPQDNVLAARIDNAWNYHEQATHSDFQWNDRNFYANYGGLNKNVFLHVTDRLYQTLPLFSNLGTTGVYIYAQDFDIAGCSARITAEAQVRNEHPAPQTFRYEVMITAPDGKLVGTFDDGAQTIAPGETKAVSASTRLENLSFWSWGYGYLYDVATTLRVDGQPVDVVHTKTGFRQTAFAHGYLALNGHPIQLKGYAQRSTNEWPSLGLSVPPWLSDFSNGLMVAGNANLVRWMHVTPWRQDVQSCDRVGLMQAMPAGDSEGDVQGRRWEQRTEVMRDAIIYNRNSPSVVFYEGGNKGISDEHMTALKTLRDQYDPHGGRAIGAREMLGSPVAEYGGEMLYVNKSAAKPLWATEYSRDEALRKNWDDWTPPFHKDGDGPEVKPGESGAAYNRNQDSFAVEQVRRWYDFWRERPGTGERVSAGGVKIIFSDSNTHARGAENYRRSGAVDAMRLPKDDFYVQQVMWDGWVDVEQPRAYLVGHWNYAAGVRKPVYVVSSADKVELFVNGQSQGFGEQSTRFLYTWKDVAFQPGEIRAVGYDAGGVKLSEVIKRTAGEPAALKLTPWTAPGGLQADGADLALVDVEVVDAQGDRCPTASSTVHFDLQGPAEWRGGLAQIPDNDILAHDLPVEAGVNRVILRAHPNAGKIVLRASADGLKPVELEITSQAVTAPGGLSAVLPGADLPGLLTRNPAPLTNLTHPTRRAVRIVGSAASSNAADAPRSYDDNEATAWKSDGNEGTAWIEYTLDHPAPVSELTLKLGGWRNKSYPVRVLVDGKAAYAGTTPKTLGYVTLTFPPVTGRTVRLELAGSAQEGDAFGLVEVTGQKLADAKPTGKRGTLEIVEAEIYEPFEPR